MSTIDPTCKICRRQGAKLFLKGERCLGPKCAMVKRSFSPGLKGKRRGRGISEYGRELREKQRLKNWYHLKEKQFKRYVMTVLEGGARVENPADLLIKKLELRFDNVIFRLGLAASRSQARQLVTHGHFLINGKKVDRPSYQLKKGDKVTLRESSFKKDMFKRLVPQLKKHQTPSWLKLNPAKLQGEVGRDPDIEEAQPPAEIPLIFEFYSK